MKRLAFWILLATFGASVPATSALPETLAFEDVRAGMTGEGFTVFSGTRIEPFSVEILGKLPKVGPGQSLILARLSGGPLERTGVLSGMSGSPVFVDGRLVGAVAYSFGFAREAIAGITPIGQLLSVGDRLRGAVGGRRSGAGIPGDLRGMLGDPAAARDFVALDLTSRLTPTAAGPMPLPLAVGGLGPAGIAAVETGLRRAGMTPIQGTATGEDGTRTAPLLPGSAVGVKLVRGDVDMTATGTVTWVDGERVLAFGHPLLGLGDVDLPLTGARVETLLPSLQQSSRFAVPLAEVGAVRQDRLSGIAGRLGATASMIPVRLQFESASGDRETYSLDLADDPLLAPVLLYYTLNGILASRERTAGSLTLRLREGSVVKLDGHDDVSLENLFAGSTAPGYATGLSAYVLYLLMNNDWTPTRVLGINLLVAYSDEPRTGQIRRVALDRYRARAGETVRATVLLAPYRGSDVVLTREIRIPPETPPGLLTVHVGDALAVSRAAAGDGPLVPRDLDQLIWLINNLRKNDRVYIVASREDTGVFLGGARMPNLPPSVASILSRPRSTGNFAVLPERGVFEEQIETDYAVSGSARLQIEVEAP